MKLREVRHYILKKFLENGSPPVIEELITEFESTRQECREALLELEGQRHLVLLPGTERILMAHPFSAITTPFRVCIEGGKNYFANCAWDAIAFHVMLNEEISVASFCHHCGTPIEVTLLKNKVKQVHPKTAIVHLAMPAAQWWKNIISACSNTMVLFCSPEHCGRHADESGQTLSIEKTIDLSIPLYRKKMELKYERPSAAELTRCFTDLGLTGPFWSL